MKIKEENKTKEHKDSKEFEAIMTSIQKWVDKNDENVQFICSFMSFKGRNFDVADDRMIAYGNKECLQNIMECLNEELQKEKKEEFVNW